PETQEPTLAPGFADGIDLRDFQDVFAVVLLPTLNEEAGLARTLSELPSEHFQKPGRKIQPLIIDGGSTDGTLEVARRWGIPVLPQRSRGKGGAMLEAIAWVHRRNIPYVIVLDADATYPPENVVPALELLARGTDLVVGVRHPVWGGPSDLKDLVHRVGNLVLSYTASVLSRRPILDICSGFWGVSTQKFMDLALDDATFAIEAELVLKAVRRGFSIHQIPVSYHERLGDAKLRALRDGSRILRTIVREARPGPNRPGGVRVPGTWGRDLLSIGLTLGGPRPLVVDSGSGADEAAQIATVLRQTRSELRIRRNPRRRLTVRRPVTTASTASPDDHVGPLTVVAPPRGTGLGPTTVSIRTAHRRWTVELPADSLDPSPGSAVRSWSRSEARKANLLDHRARASSLLVVTSRLDFHPEHQQVALLAANGFRIVRAPDAEPGSEAVPALDPLGSDE
ncbi:MAG: glycosyltransferase family 2 protein, partial [Thermoplasmata archaeon]|nr:glycosyltransferase family 2 protein [Thermoplasmata archaeon]